MGCGLVTLAVGSWPAVRAQAPWCKRAAVVTTGVPGHEGKESTRVYAIVRCGGRQEKVALDDVVTVDRLPGQVGSTVTLPALLVVDGERVVSDPAELGRYQVTADIVGDAAGPKINMIHYRNKTGYRRRLGHRQRYTQVRITGIAPEAPEVKAQPRPRTRAKAQPKAEED
jgi:large subunit ribosomal protein L21